MFVSRITLLDASTATLENFDEKKKISSVGFFTYSSIGEFHLKNLNI